MQKYECKNCGAELMWSPQAGALECKYCGEQYQPSDFEDNTLEADKADASEYTVDKTYANAETSDEQTVYKCDECGAEIVAMNTTMATECPYCGRAITLTHTHKGKFRPEKLVPYKVEKEQAIEKLKEYFKKSPFTPKDFSEQAIIEQVKGLYIPFYLHSYMIDGNGSFVCEEIERKRKGDDRVNTHKVYNVKTKAASEFNRVPIDGHTQLDDNTMYALSPFEFDGIKDYAPAFMAGYYAEQPDETAESTKDRAIERGRTAVRQQFLSILNDKYDQVKTSDVKLVEKDHSAEYAMLPIWRLNAKYKDKIYQFNINGQTGKVTGTLPMSIAKVGTLSGIVGVLVALGSLIAC